MQAIKSQREKKGRGKVKVQRDGKKGGEKDLRKVEIPKSNKEVPIEYRTSD